MEVVEFSSWEQVLALSYETLLAALRLPLPADWRERVQSEVRSRDRAMYNQWVQVCGGEFK